MKYDLKSTEGEQKERIEVPFEVKTIDDDDSEYFKFEGDASTFGNIDLVDDVIEQGAFVDSLQIKTPTILWQHDWFEPIGMPEEMRETGTGLYTRARLPREDSLVKGRVIPQVKVGSIKAMSIGFRSLKHRFEEIENRIIRYIEKIDLHEVSLVTFPANPQALVTGYKSVASFLSLPADINAAVQQVKQMDEAQIKQLLTSAKGEKITVEQLAFLDDEFKTARDLEKGLRESGLFSKNASTKLAGILSGESLDEETPNDEEKQLAEELSSLIDACKEQQLARELKSLHSLLNKGN